MKNRTAPRPNRADETEPTTPAPELTVVTTDAQPKRRTKSKPEPVEPPKLTGKRGGARPGAGRPAYLDDGYQKEKSAYVSMTDTEKEEFKRLAAEAGLTLSFYLRKRLKLPIR